MFFHFYKLIFNKILIKKTSLFSDYQFMLFSCGYLQFLRKIHFSLIFTLRAYKAIHISYFSKLPIYGVIALFVGEGNGTPLQYSCLENPMDRGAWWAAVHGVAKSWRRLRDFIFSFHFAALEKEMATHSSVLAWRIPGTGEPGGLPSMGSHRVGHD